MRSNNIKRLGSGTHQAKEIILGQFILYYGKSWLVDRIEAICDHDGNAYAFQFYLKNKEGLESSRLCDANQWIKACSF